MDGGESNLHKTRARVLELEKAIEDVENAYRVAWGMLDVEDMLTKEFRERFLHLVTVKDKSSIADESA